MNQSSQKVSLTLDLRVVVGLLLVVITAMLLIWKPWSSTTAGSRTVEVTGESKLTAKPDEFVFYPTYQIAKEDKAAALAEMTAKSDQVVAGLKKTGVADSKIKTNLGAYDGPVYLDGSSKEATYTLQLTVTVASQDLAQKVQDYLNTTTPTGSISPQASFSDKKRAELETQARNAATKDARKKVDQMADNLSFNVGKVKEIRDSAGFNAIPYAARDMAVSAEPAGGTASTGSLAVQPGENDLTYSVTVTYFIK